VLGGGKTWHSSHVVFATAADDTSANAVADMFDASTNEVVASAYNVQAQREYDYSETPHPLALAVGVRVPNSLRSAVTDHSDTVGTCGLELFITMETQTFTA